MIPRVLASFVCCVAASLPAQGGYVVVAVDLPAIEAAAGFRRAAEAASTFHRAELVDWDGLDFDRLAATCREKQPANVLFVLRPSSLDLVLHRRILLQSAKVDADPCVDFAFGYLTAESGDECVALWTRIEALHQRDPLSGMWWQASVCSADTSFRQPDDAHSIQAVAGFHSPHHYFANRDAARMQAVDKALAELPSAEVAEFTGCGDPQGIWLFDDDRNRERDKHWDYAAAKIGHDPNGEMPRLLASRFRTLQLPSPIVWSGTCHSGAVERVFVEGDIVATFGRTKLATVHRLAVADSLALAWLHAGAAALLVPLGANHGLAVGNETDFALEHGASLGEVVKSTWDDVFLAVGGDLKLDLPVAGEPHRHGEQVMQGGGANRILIGDPALRPFRAVEHPRETTRCERVDGGLQVTVARQDGFVARGWDMYGDSRPNDWRVAVGVDLTALAVDGEAFTAAIEAKGGDGKALPYAVTRCVVERWHGKRVLHVQANGRRAAVENKAVTAVFTVRRG